MIFISNSNKMEKSLGASRCSLGLGMVRD